MEGQSVRIWTVSGDEVASISVYQLQKMAEERKPILALKRYLEAVHGVPRFQQRLLRCGMVLPDDGTVTGEDNKLPDGLQLLRLPLASTKLARRFRDALASCSRWKIEELLQVPADPNLRIHRCGWRPLHGASLLGSVEIVQLLLEAGADKDLTTGEDHNSAGRFHPDENFQVTPLMEAVFHSRIPVLRLLLKAKANVEKVCGRRRNWKFATALGLAASRGNLRIVQILLEAKAHDAELLTGETSLHAAVRSHNLSIVELLLQAGFSVNRNGKFGSPLHEACCRGTHHMVRLLLQAGAETNQGCSNMFLFPQYRDEHIGRCNSTPLYAACLSGHVDIVQMLLAAQADLEQAAENRDPKMSEDFFTPLHLASFVGDQRAVRLLVEAEADVDLPGSFGTALRIASYLGHTKSAGLLLDAGADKNCATRKMGLKRKRTQNDEDGDPVGRDLGDHHTPLYAACEYGNLEILQLLLHSGAPKDKALEIAREHGQEHVVNFLAEPQS